VLVGFYFSSTRLRKLRRVMRSVDTNSPINGTPAVRDEVPHTGRAHAERLLRATAHCLDGIASSNRSAFLGL